MLDGKQSRLVIRMEKIARLRAASIPDARIATLVNMTPQGLARIVALPEYSIIEKEALTRVTSLMDEALADNVQAMRSYFSAGVPRAMQALLDTIRQEKDLRSRIEASRELLDRDPNRTFSKDNISITANGRVVDIPASIFNSAMASGSAIANSVSTIPRSVAEAMVPKALENRLEDENDDEELVTA